MSPSTKIFEIAQTTDSKGNTKVAAFKVFDSQADFNGYTEIRTKYVTIRADGGLNHSIAVREHWIGATNFGRAVIQPAIIAPVAGGILGGMIP